MKHSTTYFNRKSFSDEKDFWGSADIDAEIGVLFLNIPKRQIITGYITVPLEALVEASMYNVSAILARCGMTEYQLSMERLKEIGNQLADRVITPVKKWYRTAGPEIKTKEPRKPTFRELHRKYGVPFGGAK